MDREIIGFARNRARRFVHKKHPNGLDRQDVENRILESVYMRIREIETADAAHRCEILDEALNAALNAVQDESRRNLRRLVPYQVRNAAPHLQDRAYTNLADDMRNESRRQSLRERDRICVRQTLGMMSPEDRRLAHDFMELLSWRKVAARRGMSEGTFRRKVLMGFTARFKAAWREIA